MRDAFNKELNNIAEKKDNTLLLTGDIGFQVFDEFREKYSDRFYNIGVAESNMMGIACGLALCGKMPFVYTIIPFLTMRAFEQIRTDVCIMNLPVKIIGVGGGVAYGTLGPTHHSITDIGIMRTLPNMVVVSPCDPIETKLATRAAANHNGPIYIRLGKNGEPNIYKEEYKYEIGKAVNYQEGSDIAIISTGYVTNFAIKASKDLIKENISINIDIFHTIKPIDADRIRYLANKFKTIITIEEHNVINGLGSAVADVLSEKINQVRHIKLGIQDKFCYGVGDQDYHLSENGISVSNIKNIIKKNLNG